MRQIRHILAPAVLTVAVAAFLILRTSDICAASDASTQPATPSHKEILQSLLLKADTALRQGRPELAHEIYVQAEGQAGDLPDADLGQVRADLLSGEFRRASAFALLASGEHADSMEALALGAFLEERAGQTDRAVGFLEKTRSQHPDSVALLGALAEILIDRGRGPQVVQILDTWIQTHQPQPNIYALRARAAAVTADSGGATLWRDRVLHPQTPAAASGTAAPEGDWSPPYFEPFPRTEGRTANGFVIDNGSRVVTLATAVSGARDGIYVRNGIGRLRTAHVETVDADSGLATLRLDVPYEPRWTVARDQIVPPVPGRAASAVGFGVVDPHEASWPAVTVGFLIQPRGKGPFRMSADFSAHAAGSAIFDPQGHLVGVIAPAASGSALESDPMVIPATALQGTPPQGTPPQGSSPESPAPRTSPPQGPAQGVPATDPSAPPPSPLPAKELLERVQGAVVTVLVPK